MRTLGRLQEALQVLSTNFTQKAGVFRRNDPTYIPTPLESDAIDYLCYEWDYGYEGGLVSEEKGPGTC
jgi:hypothetical protein